MLILFKMIESIDMTLCVISFLVKLETQKSPLDFCILLGRCVKMHNVELALYCKTEVNYYLANFMMR